jgi:hypothetical protein
MLLSDVTPGMAIVNIAEFRTTGFFVEGLALL